MTSAAKRAQVPHLEEVATEPNRHDVVGVLGGPAAADAGLPLHDPAAEGSPLRGLIPRIRWRAADQP
jgi:hypothetical protein